MAFGRLWNHEEIKLLGECLQDHTMRYVEIQAQHFPDRSISAIANAARKHYDYRRSAKEWTTRELKELDRILQSHQCDSWDEVAKIIPKRSATACKQAAYKHLKPPVGRVHFIRNDNHILRHQGPPPPWGVEVSKTINTAFKKSQMTKVMLMEESGASRGTIENLLTGRRIPRMPIYVRVCTSLNLDAGQVLSDALTKSRNQYRHEKAKETKAKDIAYQIRRRDLAKKKQEALA